MINRPDHKHVMFQASDPENYISMLMETGKINSDYCKKYGILYNMFCGYFRGFHNWHAAFNRIVFADSLIKSGFEGWLLYLDADAYVVDLNFDITKYLADKGHHSFIVTRGGQSGEPWDINDGVFFCNCDHADSISIIQRWMSRFEETSLDKLRAARNWYDVKSDQQMMHALLKEDARLTKSFLYEKHDFINSRRARFIKQILRATAPTVEDRLAIIKGDIEQARAASQPKPV